jgi:hypothetical protein
MSSSTTRARWSLTGAAATLAPRGWTAPAGSLRRIWSSCWVGAGIGPGGAPPGLGPAPPGGQHQHRRGHVQVAHQQPRRRPGPGHHLQLPQLGDVVALAVGQVGGRHRHRDRARPHLEAGQDRGALFTATGRGEPQMLDGRPGGWGFESRAARTNPMGQRPRVVATRGIRVAATGCAASRA